MKPTLAIALLASAGIAGIGAVDARETMLRGEESLESRDLGSNNRTNHPVCSEIVDEETGWWESRVQLRANYFTVESLVTDLDNYCTNYNDDPDACRDPSMRSSYTDLSEEELKASCIMMGSSDRRCVGNPCNQYNTGECTLQATAGRCVWLTKKQTNKANKYLGEKIYLGHGCYNNVCHAKAVGRGKLTDEECEDFSIPGVMDCTWCQGGKKYPELKGQGVGCQMTTARTTAKCAPVNNKNIDKSSIWEQLSNPKCQCSSTYTLCNAAVSEGDRGGSDAFILRYPRSSTPSPTPFSSSP
ncbi:Hypothetical Protein FCC1311_055812 [Hondaea fermentalgiana]|uniref:Secreted protein n=1 Tax=Hondaea fermentalgiana TaxID=2315210 RepID=A0A2R5GG91_9STRA|nr:Hypothetical Protein FCC1311_055812 [Hondaea fermentalgiana]|eukprot:GBG29359.1 Hypothetical Protein FCC1311_055812 [Hondaea fermentalgiana]